VEEWHVIKSEDLVPRNWDTQKGKNLEEMNLEEILKNTEESM
jgi:hypothetical protein